MAVCVLLGASRKSFIGMMTGNEDGDRLTGSLAAAMIGATAKVDLTSCNLIEFVLRLGRPVLSIQGKIKTIAKKDLKKII